MHERIELLKGTKGCVGDGLCTYYSVMPGD